MLHWLLLRIQSCPGLWVMVVLFVYALVFLCQFMVNFFKDREEFDDDDAT